MTRVEMKKKTAARDKFNQENSSIQEKMKQSKKMRN
jgi:hypothetical protein